MDLDRLNEDGFTDYVNELTRKGFFSGATKGIAMQVINEGHANHLSERQLKVLIEDGILDGNYLEECGKCLQKITWHEMYNSVNTGMCSKCS